MKFSHSKLSTILNCPATYYLSYIQGISSKIEKPALAIGSAVHWGIEHNTEDLSEYYFENSTFKKKDNYTSDQMLAEAMVHGYLKHKDEIFNDILSDEDGTKAELIEESHEIYLTGKLKSKIEGLEYHDFVGIVDLLLLTNKGFIIIDYKTSSIEPDWSKYLDQIYRYIMLIQTAFPEVPVYKIGIVNIRKTKIKQKKTENELQFMQRLKLEYDLNDENYVNYHQYSMKDIDKKYMEKYISNLSKMCDLAYNIDKNKIWYINYNDVVNVYGKSEFYDIFYQTPDAYLLYKINDYIWNEEEQKFENSRDCVPIDMLVLEKDNIMNKYSLFKEEFNNIKENNPDTTLEQFIDYIKLNYLCDNNLLNKYVDTLIFELKSKK